MRTVWKDSAPHTKPWVTLKYRDYIISQYENGWVVNIPDDDNIYYPRECALNAIDKYLGRPNRKQMPKRHELGIKIVGHR